MKCGKCNQELVECDRNQYYVFYKCGCNPRWKGVSWDWRTALDRDGKTEYPLTDCGAYIHRCPKCGRSVYRMQPSDEFCLWNCGVRVELVTIDVVESLG